ncbi:hypothetical protein LguiA_028646 [Lonicera macranthoides]
MDYLVMQVDRESQLLPFPNPRDHQHFRLCAPQNQAYIAIISSLYHESTLIDSPKYKNKGTVYVPQFKINVPTPLSLYYCTTKITNPILVIPKEMIEMSEEYTRLTFRSPKTETTHIFGDCVLKCHPNEFVDHSAHNTYNNGIITGTQVYQVPIYHDMQFGFNFCISCSNPDF